MSMHAYTEVVPHLVTVLDGAEPWHEQIVNRELWLEQEQERIAETEGGDAVDLFVAPEEVNLKDTGWIIKVDDKNGCEWEQRDLPKGSVWGNVLRKGGKTVIAWNSSEYSHVGECELSVCADELDHLLTFCTDLGLDPSRIESPGVARLTY